MWNDPNPLQFNLTNNKLTLTIDFVSLISIIKFLFAMKRSFKNNVLRIVFKSFSVRCFRIHCLNSKIYWFNRKYGAEKTFFFDPFQSEADLGLLQHPRWRLFVIIVNGFRGYEMGTLAWNGLKYNRILGFIWSVYSRIRTE